MLKLGFVLTLVLVTLVQAKHEPFHVKFQWNYINYTWPSEKSYVKAKDDGSYVESNNVISGLKLYKDRIYLTIPRRISGVPVTLASIKATPIDGNTAPLLEPFPNWDMQTIGVCRALQFVQNVEIDAQGRMWILDTGRARNGKVEYHCPPRLVILDLENNGAVLRNYPLPADVADPQTAYLYDIVLEHEDGGVAYISDADPKKPGIIVFSLQNGTFWKMSHNSTMASRDAVGFRIDMVRIKPAFNIHGMALSPASTAGNRTLYYCPLSSFDIYSIPTNVLKNETLRVDVKPHVRVLGRKTSQTDGMTMSNTGAMYFGLLNNDAIAVWDSKLSFDHGYRTVARDHHFLQWPSSISISDGHVWAISNRLHLFLEDSIDSRVPNFRLLAAHVSFGNYQFLENGNAPPLPEIK